MKRICTLASILLLTSCSLNAHFVSPKELSSNNSVSQTSKIKNVILFIGDGMGPNHVDAGGILKGEPLCFDVTNDKWAYHAYSNTDSRTSQGFTLDTSKSLLRPELNASLYDGADSPYGEDGKPKLGTSGDITTYTDSAAGGSALATGVKLTNGRIGMDIDGKPLENLVEIAKGLNKKAGVLTTDNIWGATPSDFLVHVGYRHLPDEIIRGVSTSKADLVMTTNCSEYKNFQTIYEPLFTSNGFDIAYNRQSLNSNSNKILGLFDKITSRDDPRAPSLHELTTFALDKLDNDEGFFLMVEGSNIDKQSHNNQAGMMLEELLGFDKAVEAATKWAEGRDDTLIVVTADHETGGLYYDRENTSRNTIAHDIKWKSRNHSRTRVDIAVWGDITNYINKYSNHFGELEGLPYWDNTDVFKLCSSYLTSQF